MINELIFSPTGGTQKVVNELVNPWNMTINKIDLMKPDIQLDHITFTDDDIVVIAVCSFGGRVPALASERIQKLNGHQARCILVCVYGNRAYEDTLLELYDLAKQCHFSVIGAVAAIAEHSIIHEFAQNRPDLQDQKELHQFSRQLYQKLKNKNISTSDLAIPGQRPYKKSGNLGLVPKANNKCNHCGICVQVCPTQAISQQHLKSADKNKCISCMRCVSECPHGARHVNSLLVFAARQAIKKQCLQRKNNELFI